jgi:transcriptional regulator with XRE-family HTH domain
MRGWRTMPARTPWFAGRLKDLREGAALSQYALARRSGLSKQALSNLELGTREPTWETVQRLALALGVDCREFVDPELALPPERPPGRRGRPPKPKAEGSPPPAPPAPPPAEDLEGQAKAGPAATRGAKPRRPRARRPKGN